MIKKIWKTTIGIITLPILILIVIYVFFRNIWDKKYVSKQDRKLLNRMVRRQGKEWVEEQLKEK